MLLRLHERQFPSFVPLYTREKLVLTLVKRNSCPWIRYSIKALKVLKIAGKDWTESTTLRKYFHLQFIKQSLCRPSGGSRGGSMGSDTFKGFGHLYIRYRKDSHKNEVEELKKLRTFTSDHVFPPPFSILILYLLQKCH